MDIDLTESVQVHGVAIEGRFSVVGQYVTKITFQISGDNVNWNDIDDGKIYNANIEHINRVILFFERPYFGRYLRFLPVESNISNSLRAGVIICTRDDNFNDIIAQLPPTPDLELKASEHLEEISNIHDYHGKTTWKTSGPRPRIFHGRYGWNLKDSMEKTGGENICLKQYHTLAHWIYMDESVSS